MKAWALPLILAFVASPATAQDACQMANEGGPDGAIVERACRALEQRDLYRLRFAAEAKARALAEAAPLGSDERYLLMQKWEAINTLLNDARIDMSREMNGVISDTLARYGIAPAEGDGDITGGPGKGLRAHWEPRYKMRFEPAHPLLNEIKLKNGQVVYLKWEQGREPEERAQAFTWFNGRVDVLDEAFERVYESRSPRMLGFLLHHESVHFDQLRNGSWKTQNLREVAAYTESIKAASRFGLTPAEIGEIKDKLLYNQARVDAQRQWRERAPTNLPPPDVQARNKDEWDDYTTARKLMQEGRDKLKADLEEERQREANTRNAPAPEPEEETPSAPLSGLDLLEAHAKFFCESPQMIHIMDVPLAEWRETLSKVPSELATLDYDRQTGTMPCYKYVTYQSIGLHRRGYDLSNVEFLLGVVEEGLIRQTNPTPRIGRVEYTPPPSQAPPGPLPTPVSPPDISGPDDRTPPAIPHCRYHAWCKG